MSDSSPESHRRLPQPTDGNSSVPHLENPKTQDVFNSIVKGRKSWKTLRGGEVVWPPELEAALIDGLENYKPDDSRETRLLGRFPLRNRFISDWIYERTGKRRTAKQVGSRLQQLRDTCGGKRLVNLISPRRPIPNRTSLSLSPRLSHNIIPTSASSDQDGESCSDASSAGSPTTPTEVHATLQSLLYRGVASSTEAQFNSVTYIDLLKGFAELPTATSPMADDELLWSERGLEVIKISPHPRYIAEIDPTITFTSRLPKSGVSLFSLYANGELVHSESSSLRTLGPLDGTSGHYLYTTSLLPRYWPKLVQIADLSQYTIIHRVEECNSSSDSKPATLFATMYKFRYLSSTMPYHPTQLEGRRLDDVEIHRDSEIDYAAFDSLLALPSSDGYDSASPVYDKPPSLYDIPSNSFMRSEWNGYSTTYQSSH